MAKHPGLTPPRASWHGILGAYVVGLAAGAKAERFAFALGDGTVHLATFKDPEAPTCTKVEAHHGGALCIAALTNSDGFVSGGDDGKLVRISSDGEMALLHDAGNKWVETVATSSGLIAASIGKTVLLFDEKGQQKAEWGYPSTVSGLTFDPKGKRLIASHYNGATIRFVAAKTDSPRLLEWKGSHLGVAISPDGGVVVTTMQENALHGWRLVDGQHMRMSGYPSKSRSLSFTRTGKWLATSGAEPIVLWPFTGGGPMGKEPTELDAGNPGAFCTAVASNPAADLVASGFADGAVSVADIDTKRAVRLRAADKDPISVLAWSPGGRTLAYGTEGGGVGGFSF